MRYNPTEAADKYRAQCNSWIHGDRFAVRETATAWIESDTVQEVRR